MQRLTWLLVLLALGCDRRPGATPAVPSGGAPARRGAALLPEERAVEAWVRKNYRMAGRFAWGPHDLGGRLCGEIQRRRGEGRDWLPTNLQRALRRGDRVVRVQFYGVRGGSGATHDLLFIVRGGKLAPQIGWAGGAEAPFVPFHTRTPGVGGPSGELETRTWIDWEVEELARDDGARR